MKTILRVCVFVNLFVFTSILSYGQTCGILSVGVNLSNGMQSPNYTAAVPLQSGWSIYEYEWKVNGNVFSTDWQFLNWPPRGYNEICLTVKATKSATGDSCIRSYCNIFYSPGASIYPETYDVYAPGLNILTETEFLSGDTIGAIYYSYDYGDGYSNLYSISNSDLYTYANPGVYDYSVSVSNTFLPNIFTLGLTTRKVHVGNGIPNLKLTGKNAYGFCDSIVVSITTNSPPNFFTGWPYSGLNQVFAPFFNSAGVSHIKMKNVPGHDFIQINTQDTAQGTCSGWVLATLPVCNIIPDTVYGTVYLDSNFNGLMDPGESGIPNLEVYAVSFNHYGYGTPSQSASYKAVTDSAGNYKILVPHDKMVLRLTNNPGYTATSPTSAGHVVTFTTGTGHSNFNFGLSTYLTRICGKTYLDDDQDNIYSASSDRILKSVHIKALNTSTGLEYHTVTNSSGDYCFDLPPGNFILKPTYYLLDSAVVYPDSIIVNSTTGGNFNARNFGFQSIVPINFGIYLGQSTMPRPGFNYTLNANVNNTGFLKGKGEVVLNYSPLLNYLSSSPAGGVVNTTAKTITWITDSINTGAQNIYSATFNLPIPTPLGTSISSTATISALPGFTENDFSNNTSQLNTIAVGSFDPNDKSVSPSGAGFNGATMHGERLHYRINFQNTGTASAINIVVMDTLDTDVDMNTFLMERASHNYKLRTEGRVLIWRFENIQLPDSNTNEPLSHGFIEYSISPVPGLADGTEIKNTADIYFDFNPPVITNTTLNTMTNLVTSINGFTMNESFNVYPVPAKDNVYVQNMDPCNLNSCLFSVELYDITGKKLHQFTNVQNNIRIDISTLASGVYYLKMKNANKIVTRKFIKQ